MHAGPSSQRVLAIPAEPKDELPSTNPDVFAPCLMQLQDI